MTSEAMAGRPVTRPWFSTDTVNSGSFLIELTFLNGRSKLSNYNIQSLVEKEFLWLMMSSLREEQQLLPLAWLTTYTEK